MLLLFLTASLSDSKVVDSRFRVLHFNVGVAHRKSPLRKDFSSFLLISLTNLLYLEQKLQYFVFDWLTPEIIMISFNELYFFVGSCLIIQSSGVLHIDKGVTRASDEKHWTSDFSDHFHWL